MDRVRLRDYRTLVTRGRKFYSPNYLIYAMPYARTVVKPAVKKKVGVAVMRNLEKRHIREALRSLALRAPHLVLIILTRPHSLGFSEKKKSLLACLRPLLAHGI